MQMSCPDRRGLETIVKTHQLHSYVRPFHCEQVILQSGKEQAMFP